MCTWRGEARSERSVRNIPSNVRAAPSTAANQEDAEMAEVRDYEVHASSTGTFGRVLVSCRDQHLVSDGPVQNGCPGEAPTPAELFLAGIAACGVELLDVLARERQAGLTGVIATVHGAIDPSDRVRADVTVFNEVSLQFELSGVGDEEAALLVEAFKGR
jgi:uncharacterized OsmC-like protein